MPKKNAKRRQAANQTPEETVNVDETSRPEESAEPAAAEEQASDAPGKEATTAATDASPQAAGINQEPVESPEEREKVVLDQLSWVYDTWKRVLEKKDWNSLVELIGLPEIFISGHPQNAAELARRLKDETAKLCDFEAVMGEIYRKQITADSARFSFRLDVMWSSAEDWEDHMMELIVHVGFRLSRDSWVTTHLLLERAPRTETAAAPVPTRPQPAAAAGERAPAVEQPQATDAPSGREDEGEDRPLTDDQFAEAAALYFASPSGAPQSTTYPSSPSAISQTSGKKRLVYVPVLMDEDLIRDLLS